MATKRMFNNNVVGTDEFMGMSCGARALYFSLSMRADDDGFVSSPKIIRQECRATARDMDMLIRNGFLIRFPSGIVVVRHWHLNNTLRQDTYRPTRYVQELSQLETGPDGAYDLRKELTIENLSESNTTDNQTAPSDTPASNLGIQSAGESVTSAVQPRTRSVTSPLRSRTASASPPSRPRTQSGTQIRQGKIRTDQLIPDQSATGESNDANSDASANKYILSYIDLTPSHMEELQSFRSDGINNDLIRYAVDEAISHNARNWSYVRSILQNLLDHHVTTVAQARALNDKRSTAKTRSLSSHNYQEHSYVSEADYGHVELTPEEQQRRIDEYLANYNQMEETAT